MLQIHLSVQWKILLWWLILEPMIRGVFNKTGICYFYKGYAVGDRNLVPIVY